MPPISRLCELPWPVLSAVRVGTADNPAVFIVVVDCGEPTPSERYATLSVSVWSHLIKFGEGEYDLSFAEAQRSLAERAGLSALLPRSLVEVVVERDPDYSNEYTVVIDGEIRADGTSDRVKVITHDIDFGASEITSEWVAAAVEATEQLSPAAAAHARDVIATYACHHLVEPL
jgi:hypothetical protein